MDTPGSAKEPPESGATVVSEDKTLYNLFHHTGVPSRVSPEAIFFVKCTTDMASYLSLSNSPPLLLHTFLLLTKERGDLTNICQSPQLRNAVLLGVFSA